MPGGHSRPETRVSGLSWEPDKIVVGAVLEVMPHPNADRLVLCRLDDGAGIQIVLTGAPNLLPFKGQGPLPKPIKVAYAREGREDLRRSPAGAGADHAQARQDPRRRVLLDGLLGEGAGHLGRSRGDHLPG